MVSRYTYSHGIETTSMVIHLAVDHSSYEVIHNSGYGPYQIKSVLLITCNFVKRHTIFGESGR